MKAAIYLRVSTEDQRERQSIATQHDFAVRFCGLHEIPLADFYADDGISGTVPLEHREQGARLLKDAREKRFDAVLVYKLDRLGREPRLILNAVKELEDLGVEVKSMTEPFETSTPAGRFLLTILSGVAGLERDNIIQRSAEGIGRLVREGAWVGGIVPYGYRVEGKRREARLVVSEVRIPRAGLTEADVVRLVFRMSGDEGKSCVAIADHLNQLGVPAAYLRNGSADEAGKRKRATAGIWRDSRIQYLLTNTTYRGLHRYGKHPNNRQRPRAVVERPVPAIVDATLWERAQQTLRRNRLFSRRNARHDYLMRGLMKCGHCGRTYVGTIYTGAKRPTRLYYVCGGRHKGKRAVPDPALRCQGMAVSGDIEQVIWADIERFLRNPGAVLTQLEARLNTVTEGSVMLESRLQALKAALAGKDSERTRVIGLFRRGRIDDTALDQQLEEVESERTGLVDQIRLLEADEDHAREAEAELLSAAELLAELNRRVDETMSYELKRQVVEKLIEGVTIRTVGEGADRDTLVSVTYRFSVPDPSIGPHTNRGIRVLQTLALPLGYAAIPLLANCFRCGRVVAGYRTGYRFQPHHLCAHHRVRDAPVALRRHDRRVTQQLLKGGETTAPIHPRASERVPQHVDMESLDSGQPRRRSREVARLGKRVRARPL